MATKKGSKKKTSKKRGRGRPSKTTPSGAEAATPAKSKADKFVELGQKRTAKALKAIRQIANLSNKANYEYTEEQVERIHTALTDAINASRARFEKGSAAKDEFKLL